MADSETGDTALMRMKICSLAGIGKIGIAESLAVVHQIALRSQILDYYTDHLIGIKNYGRARYFLDSIITDTFQDMAAISYKWALLPFIQGDHGTALDRLQLFIQNFPEGRCYYHACFKIATILYFNQDFNQAAYYYAIAAQYDSLSYDALKNQMICAKKG